ncbi:MAG: phosphoribosyltransferase family protein [Pyrinomonadaceae bacterium]
MTDDVLISLPARRGHFLLESGYHTDLWFNLDALFITPNDLTLQITTLSDLFRSYSISAVCGPLLGGAFLAHAVATQMGLRFYYTQQVPTKSGGPLFAAEYQLPPELRRQVGKERIAIVDDVVSAGSSVRATAAALTAAGAQTVVVGTLLVLGNQAIDYFATRGIPLVALVRQDFNLWAPDNCQLCRSGASLENPVKFSGYSVAQRGR